LIIVNEAGKAGGFLLFFGGMGWMIGAVFSELGNINRGFRGL